MKVISILKTVFLERVDWVLLIRSASELIAEEERRCCASQETLIVNVDRNNFQEEAAVSNTVLKLTGEKHARISNQRSV